MTLGRRAATKRAGVNEQVGAPIAAPVSVLAAERLAGCADDRKVEIGSAQAFAQQSGGFEPADVLLEYLHGRVVEAVRGAR